MNRGKKRRVRGLAVPDRNDEYFLYQTLLGAFPFSDAEYPEFIRKNKGIYCQSCQRSKGPYRMAKARHRVRRRLSCHLLEKILACSEANAFLKELISFSKRVSHFGMLNSLSQTLIKIASPGVPDFYQGTELWDLSLVDPDNRRPVDFEKRCAMLASIREQEDSNIGRLIQDLLSTREDGKIKLFLIYRALKARRDKSRDLPGGRLSSPRVGWKIQEPCHRVCAEV